MRSQKTEPVSGMSAPIHIVLAFDDNFWAPAFTLMRSACLSTHRRQDLVFHLLVLWAECGVTIEDVRAELRRREGLSGIEEKKARQLT